METALARPAPAPAEIATPRKAARAEIVPTPEELALRTRLRGLYAAGGLPRDARSFWRCLSELVGREVAHWDRITPAELALVVERLLP